MRKKMILVLLSLCLLFSFSITSFAESDGIEVGSEDQLILYDNSYLADSVDYSLDDSPVTLAEPSWPGSSVSFHGNALVNGTLVGSTNGDGTFDYAADYKYVPANQYYYSPFEYKDGSSVYDSVFCMWTFEETIYLNVTGFDPQSSYDGVGYVEFRDNTGGNLYYNTREEPGIYSVVNMTGYDKSTGSSHAVYPVVMRSVITDISVTDFFGNPLGFSLYYAGDPTFQSGNNVLWRLRYYVNDMYTGDSSYVGQPNIRIAIKTRYTFRTQYSVFASQPSPGFAIYRNFRVYDAVFNGWVSEGYNVAQDYESDKLISAESSMQDELVNGYENDSGASTIETGAASVESGVSVEHDALGSAGSMAETFDYSGGDLTELAAAFSLISGWFMSLVAALGSWNMLIYVSLTMVVALFAVGYFRNR